MKRWYLGVIYSISVASIAAHTYSDRCERVTLRARASDTSSTYITRIAEVERKQHARATVILCHGFMCSRDDMKFLRWLFSRENTIVFDFRGHGEYASHQSCTFGYDEAHDVIAAADFARSDEQLSKVPLLVYGFSMGAAASIRAQAMRPDAFDGAMWDAPFDSTDATLRRCIEKLHFTVWGYKVPVLGRNIMQRYVHRPWVQGILKMLLKNIAHIDTSPVNTCIIRMAPYELIRNVTIPTLIIGCWNDERTPYDAVKHVYENAAGRKELWMTPGRKHFDSFFHNPEGYYQRIQQFIDTYVHDDEE